MGGKEYRTMAATETGQALSREVAGFVGEDFMERGDAWEVVAPASS